MSGESNKLSISDIEYLEMILAGKATQNHNHDINELNGFNELLDSLFKRLSAVGHTHEMPEIAECIKTVDTLKRDLETLRSKVESMSRLGVTSQSAAVQPQIIQKTEQVVKTVGKISYRDITDVNELFEMVKRKAMPRLIVTAKEPSEDLILNISINIVNPTGYCLSKAVIELVENNNVLTKVDCKDIASNIFTISIGLEPNEVFKGIITLKDPMNPDLSISEPIRLVR